MPTFTETYAAPRISVNTGGQFTTAINLLPQVGQYSGLYQQYKIIAMKVMILPQFTDYEGNAGIPLVGASAPRLVYVVNDTPNGPAPVSEAAVLTDNGCRIITLNKKTVIRCKPVPERVTSPTGVEMRDRVSPWLSFAKPGQVDPTHWGIDYYISGDLAGGGTGNPKFDIYYKITFQLRDPK